MASVWLVWRPGSHNAADVLDGRGAGRREPVAVAPRNKAPQRAGRFAQAAAEEFRLLVEGVKDYAIFLLDRNGYVMTWNAGAERIKQYSADEILGEHFSRFYPPADREAGRPAMALETAAREGRFEGHGWRVRKDGSRFYAHVSSSSPTRRNSPSWAASTGTSAPTGCPGARSCAGSMAWSPGRSPRRSTCLPAASIPTIGRCWSARSAGRPAPGARSGWSSASCGPTARSATC